MRQSFHPFQLAKTFLGLTFACTLVLAQPTTNLVVAQEADAEAEAEAEESELGALDFGPLEADLSEFVKSKKRLVQLGKAFFWDMQVGSDGRTACATCHFHAGVDV